jgi:hypothetical protein
LKKKHKKKIKNKRRRQSWEKKEKRNVKPKIIWGKNENKCAEKQEKKENKQN